MEPHSCNPTSLVDEEGGLQIQGQPEIHSETLYFKKGEGNERKEQRKREKVVFLTTDLHQKI
jgi:hypothetical protein